MRADYYSNRASLIGVLERFRLVVRHERGETEFGLGFRRHGRGIGLRAKRLDEGFRGGASRRVRVRRRRRLGNPARRRRTAGEPGEHIIERFELIGPRQRLTRWRGLRGRRRGRVDAGGGWAPGGIGSICGVARGAAGGGLGGNAQMACARVVYETKTRILCGLHGDGGRRRRRTAATENTTTNRSRRRGRSKATARIAWD